MIEDNSNKRSITFDATIKQYINQSVLCWLATSDEDNFPNVSPKEMFTYFEENKLLISNIASPNSVENIKVNNKVCVSFVDVFVQKGFKIKGIARIIEEKDIDFETKVGIIKSCFTDIFPIPQLIEIEVQKIESIKAPSYFMFPNITEQEQIESAMKTYKVKNYKKD
jgi:predicted pyridoxine 5'-phosphate oxidase superfamily flavin-nucleotide-binding protein